MIKHTQILRQLLPTNCLNVFDHFMGLALKGLRTFLASETTVAAVLETFPISS